MKYILEIPKCFLIITYISRGITSSCITGTVTNSSISWLLFNLNRLKNWCKSIITVEKWLLIIFKKYNLEVMKFLFYFFSLFHEHLLVYILNICNFSSFATGKVSQTCFIKYLSKQKGNCEKLFANSFWSLFLCTSRVVNIKTKIQTGSLGPQNRPWLMCLIVPRKEAEQKRDYLIKHLLESQLLLFSTSSIHLALVLYFVKESTLVCYYKVC